MAAPFAVCGLVVLTLCSLGLLRSDWPYRRSHPPVGRLYDVTDEGHKGAILFARWLGSAVPTGTPVAVRDCGLLPFYSDLQVIDIFGLCNRRVALAKASVRQAHGPWTDHAVFVPVVLSYRPAYVVLTDPEWLDMSDPVVNAHYAFMSAVTYSGSADHEPDLYIYRRLGAAELDIPDRFRAQYVTAGHSRGSAVPPPAAQGS